MRQHKTINVCLAILLTVGAAFGQKGKPGGVKGRVHKKESGAAVAGVRVTLRQGESEVKRVETDRRGQFEFAGLAPGKYSLTFHKDGLSTAEVKDVEVEAGKVRSFGDRIVLPVDEGTLTLLKGSVFNEAGLSLADVRIELARVEANGTAKKLDGSSTNETGEFSFRLTPQAALYRVTARANGMTATKEVSVDGVAVYRVALTLKPAAP